MPSLPGLGSIRWPDAAQIGPLLAGLAYAVGWIAATRGAHHLSRRLDRATQPFLVYLRHWEGWPGLVHSLGVCLALAFPFAMVLTGVYTGVDVGIQPSFWWTSWPQELLITGVGMGWIWFLWTVHWRTATGGADADRPKGQNLRHWTSVLSDALRHEAELATYRGALMPLLGPYWGVWVAVGAKMLAMSGRADIGAALGRPGQREDVFMDWALDWVAALLYIVAASAVPAAVGRAICLAILPALVRATGGRRARPVLAQYEGQPAQRDEHAGGEDGHPL